MKITNFIVLIIVLILILVGIYYYWKNQKKIPSPPSPVPPSPVPPSPVPPSPVPPPPTPSPPVPSILCNNQFKPKKNPPGCVLCASPVEAWDSIYKKCIKWENS